MPKEYPGDAPGDSPGLSSTAVSQKSPSNDSRLHIFHAGVLMVIVLHCCQSLGLPYSAVLVAGTRLRAPPIEFPSNMDDPSYKRQAIVQLRKRPRELLVLATEACLRYHGGGEGLCLVLVVS